MVSADNAHATHPNHPEYADPVNQVFMNEGIVIKFNASQRYTTDGVSEAMNEAHELFGEARIAQIMNGAQGLDCRTLIDRVMQGVRAHRGQTEPSDDITMLAFRRTLES